jgi:hypothetical protein
VSVTINDYVPSPPRRNIRPFRVFLYGYITIIVLFVVTVLSENIMDHGILDRLVYTSAELAVLDAGKPVLKFVTFTHEGKQIIACPMATMSEADKTLWVAYARVKGWWDYPEKGPLCVDP